MSLHDKKKVWEGEVRIWSVGFNDTPYIEDPNNKEDLTNYLVSIGGILDRNGKRVRVTIELLDSEGV